MHAVVKWIEQHPDRVQAHLPEGWTPEIAKRSLMAVLQTDKQNGGKIAACTPESLTLALLQAASYGLQLDTSDAYIIPYGKEATLSIGWQGLVKLAKRAGEVRDIEAEVVYEGERCIVARGTDPSRHGIVHELSLDRGGEVIGVYALITLSDGSKTFEYASKADIDEARKASKASNSPAWRNWYGEMAKKFVIRRSLKRFSLDDTAARAIARDEALHVGSATVNGSSLDAGKLNARLGLTVGSLPAPSPEPEPEPAEDLPREDEDAELRRSLGQLLRGISGPVDEAKARILEMDEATQSEWMIAIKDADSAELAGLVEQIAGASQ